MFDVVDFYMAHFVYMKILFMQHIISVRINHRYGNHITSISAQWKKNIAQRILVPNIRQQNPTKYETYVKRKPSPDYEIV